MHLARRCPFVSIGREVQISRGLLAGSQVDVSTAIQLLIPQLEHLVRMRLKAEGPSTQTISGDGVQTENSLGSLVQMPAALEVFGADRSFELQALFCDPMGMNLRNDVAHGLLDDDAAGSIHSLYAW